MCDDDATLQVPPHAYDKIPLNIESDDPLLNVGKKELSIALQTAAENPWVAEWLFTDPGRPFHPHISVPPEAFEKALAIHLHHDISTPDCAPVEPYQRILPSSEKPKKIVVSKDIDLLLVPVARMDGVTVGYTFIRGIREHTVEQKFRSAFGAPHPSDFDFNRPLFVPGRFTFHNERRDYLMVVNGMSPIMTGIVSMRWRDHATRDRCFFAIPKAEYGPNNLPRRVLSVQCNVDHVVGTDPTPPPQDTTSQLSQQLNTHQVHQHQQEQQVQQLPKESLFDIHVDSNVQPFLEPKDQQVPSPLLKFDAPLDNSWAQGLETLGTIISPEQANGIPEIMQDFFPNTSMDDMAQLLSSPETFGDDNSPFPLSDDLQHSTSPAESSLTSSSGSTQPELASKAMQLVPEMDSVNNSWILTDENGRTPDGVGVPRRPGGNDTSSGAFDMSSLFDSLRSIERSLKGHFFSPKVRKDIMHPQTGELISRSTGQLMAKLDTIDSRSLQLFREVAAQSYYSSVMSMSRDNLLLPLQPLISPTPMIQAVTPIPQPPRSVRQKTIQKRVAPAPLAPRPVSIAAAAVAVAPDDETVKKSEEEAARQAKLEVKRIKNRMSAARSNQKRRAQLEAQRKELAALRKRVEELTSKKQVMMEENMNLRKQVQKS
ncbi:hypothetical protein BWQ96_02581 [Gracilariopsis chorda]|uniref:BZIP domain-containing protein n=1 Tax=Gracilariopsis chorda TaxID=448386 RepID=A0A2V3IZL6_9FLOR|nr:hypothetical protein BWQ96_02581 [Gracilariopsis chorda]|eukprot:PXF47602.1 hypothetical protein BWQ96_02581 [Gracilariopsis chorda]